MKYCSYCGTQLNDNDKECSNCHRKCNPVQEVMQISEQNLKSNFSGENKAENLYGVEQKKKKHKKLIANIIIASIAGIIVLACIIGLLIPPRKDNYSKKDNYYYYDNKFNQETVDKFLSVWDDEVVAEQLGISLSSVDDFDQDGSYSILDEDADRYVVVDDNAKTLSGVWVNDKNKVVVYEFTLFQPELFTGKTTTDTYHHLIEKPAAWLYALSDDKSFAECFEIVEKFQFDVKKSYEENNLKDYYYHDGYTMRLINGKDGKIPIELFMKTDEGFSETHDAYTLYKPND